MTPSASKTTTYIINSASIKAKNQFQLEAESLTTDTPHFKKESIVHARHARHAQAEVLYEQQSESELTTGPQTVSEGTSEPQAEPETWPEPGPEWKKAFKKWKWAWHIHVYVFATAFLFIGFYAGYYVVLNIYDGLGGKHLSVCLNAMVFLFGITRAFVMFLDPYHQGNLISAIFVMRLLWSIGGPCLTASDSLIILALIETSRVSIAPPRFQKLKTISIIIAIHFVLVIVSDTVVSTYMEAKVMILMCQVFFSVWGITLGAGYVRLAYKMNKQLFSHKQVKAKADKIYIFLIYASAAANFFICGVMIYTMAGVFGVYTDITFVDAWHWWTLQTLFRVGEVVTCVLIFTVSAKRSRVKSAADEIYSEFDSQSQAFESSSYFRVLQALQQCCVKLRKRNRVIDSSEITAETTVTSVAKKANSTTAASPSDEGNEFPTSFQAFQARGRGRRQSLFSHMQEASIENRISKLEKSPAIVPSSRTRGRRQSLFSAMHEASINNAISNFANALSEAHTNTVACESLDEPDLESSQEPPPAPLPRRGRRMNVFSTLQETKPAKVIGRSAKMEDIKEESVLEVENEPMKRSPFFKMRSSERLRQLVQSFLSSGESESQQKQKNTVSVPEPIESEGNSEDSNSIPVEYS